MAREYMTKDYIRAVFPYGKWVTEDGTEILFNRNYQPIWMKRSSGEVTKADPNWWVPNILTQEWYYDETCPPYGDGRKTMTKNSLQRVIDALNKFGIKTIKLEAPRCRT